jgi:hypothetical protein
MRNANPRATITQWTPSHPLHHTLTSAMPLQPTGLSSHMPGLTTSPPLVATLYGPPSAVPGHSPFPCGPPPHFPHQHFSHAQRGAHTSRGGRRPTIDPVVAGRAAHEATGFDKDALNRSMKMSISTIWPNSDFKQGKTNFLNFLSLKAAYLIPQLAIRESGAWLDEQAQHYAYTLLLHAANDNKRDDQAMKSVSSARPDCATTARDILCERLDCKSFARSLSLCMTTSCSCSASVSP